MALILVIDDDPQMRLFFTKAFWEPTVTIRSAESSSEALAVFASIRPDVVLLDVHLGKQSGLELFQRLHAMDPGVPIILMTGQGTAAIAIEAMGLGAYEYLLKPFNVQQLRTVVFRAAEVRRLMREPASAGAVPHEPIEKGLIVGQCPAMQEVYKAIGRVAKQDVTVLILGESGTGKELVARAIYQYSRRANKPFLAINCAAIPEALLESELFGHEKGAFTGADRKRIGKFEQCNGGTLFLDEIGDMSPLTQTKVLRILQEQCFERVGGEETIHSDVRIVAATHCDLEQMVADGTYRMDLFYRINVYSIRLPALRERLDDLPLLVNHFVRQYAQELNKEIYDVTAEALELLRAYSWPGNVRELQSVLRQAILHATAPRLFPEFLPTYITRRTSNRSPLHASASAEGPNLDQFLSTRLDSDPQNLLADWQALNERMLLSKVLAHTAGNLSQAARILGIDRGTLRAKLKSHDPTDTPTTHENAHDA
jgi:nitrogen regulation protein NR(I)